MMTEDFSKNLIKEYKFWDVYINPNQNYLGRCVIWCKRQDALDLGDATPEEQEELFLVLHNLREASKEAFAPDWFNYAFLGNVTRHLHGHFIPRYGKLKVFMGTTFTDELYGKYPGNVDTYQVGVSPEVLAAMRDALAKALG